LEYLGANSPWYMDSGASMHIASNSEKIELSRPSTSNVQNYVQNHEVKTSGEVVNLMPFKEMELSLYKLQLEK